MRKITLLLAVIAVLWTTNLFAQTWVEDTKYTEDFSSTTGTWVDGTKTYGGPSGATGTSTGSSNSLTTTIDGTNKNCPVSIKTYAGPTYIAQNKNFASSYTSTSGKLTIQFVCKFGVPNTSNCAGYFYFRDASNRAIFGLGIARVAGYWQAVRMTAYTEYINGSATYPTISNAALFSTLVNSPAAQITAVLDFNANPKTVTLTAVAGTYTAGATPDFVATTPANAYNGTSNFLDQNATDVSNMFFEANNTSTSGGVPASEYFRFDDIKIAGEKQSSSTGNITLTYVNTDDNLSLSGITPDVSHTGLTSGSTYTASSTEMANFTSGGYNYIYDPSSTNSALVPTNTTSTITLKFKKYPVLTNQLFTWGGYINGTLNDFYANFSSDGSNRLGYQSSNELLFPSSASNKTVTLNSAIDLGVNNLAVSGTGYNLGGTGSLAGTGGLNINLTGTDVLTLNLTNNMTGATTITGGSTTLSKAGVLPTGSLTISGASTITHGTNSISIPSSTFNASSTLAASSYYGSSVSTISAGPGVKISISGSYATSNANVVYSIGTTGTLSTGSELELNGTGTSVENKFQLTAANSNYLANARVTLKGNAFLAINSNQGAATIMNIGTLAAESGTKLGWGASSALDRTITWSVGANNETSEFAGTLTNIGGYNAGGHMWLGRYTNLTKVGTGTLTLSGTSTDYNGDLTITNGELIISGSIRGNNQAASTSYISSNVTYTTPGPLSNAVNISGSDTKLTVNGSLTATTITVATNSTLQGQGTVTGSTTINGILQGTVSVAGATTVSTTGTLSGSHSFGSDLSLAGTTNLTVTDFTSNYNVLTVAGTVTNGGTLNITLPATAPEVGTNIKLINAGGYSGTFTTKTLPSGYRFDDASGTLYYDGTTISSNTTLTTIPGNGVVTVNSGELTINQNVVLSSLIVAPGAKVTLNTGKTLTATTVTLQSSPTGTATFVDADPTGSVITATVQQYLPQGRNWYVGVPFTDASGADASILTAAGLGSSVSYWNETTGAWVNNYSGTLNRGKGYISVSASGTATNNISFAGTLNTGNVPVTVTRTVGATKEGFNLIANPYPSYLNPCDLITASAKMEPTIWYRTKGTSYEFETVNTASGEGTNVSKTGTVTGYVPPMQAFWVRVKPNSVDAHQNNSETLTFTNAMRYHANPTVDQTIVTTTVMKAPSETKSVNSKLRLVVSNGINSDEALIYTNSNAANGYDAYDSQKMSNANPFIPEIYTMVGNENLVINGLNSIQPNMEIPLGFTTGQLNTFTIKASEISNFDAGTSIILHDDLLKTDQELTVTNEYSFTSDPATTATRFSIIFKTAGTTTDIDTSPKNQNISTYATTNNQIIVNCSQTGIGTANVSIFNAIGQKLESKKINDTTTVLTNSYVSGVYFVIVRTNGKTTTQKIVLK